MIGYLGLHLCKTRVSAKKGVMNGKKDYSGGRQYITYSVTLGAGFFVQTPPAHVLAVSN